MKGNSMKLILFVVMVIIFVKLSNVITNPILSMLCFALYIMAMWLLFSWKTFNAKWVCDECGEEFEISFFNNMKSFFLHMLKNKMYYRYLYCNKCKKQKWCRCIFKDN